MKIAVMGYGTIRIMIGFSVHNGFQTAMEEKNLQTKTAAEG